MDRLALRVLPGLFLCCLWTIAAPSQPASLQTSANLVRLSHRLTVDQVHPGDSFPVEVVLNIAKGWHVQAAKPTLDYLIPTRLALNPEGKIRVSEICYPNPRSIDFDGEKIDVLEGESILRFTVTLARDITPGPHVLRGTLTVQACDDKTCVAPSTSDVEIPFQVLGGATPAAVPSTVVTTPSSALSLWNALLGAFLGGIILNLMPCVLPVIAIKILGFAKQGGGSKPQTRQLGLLFGLGILVSFWGLAALVIAVQAAGRQIGWGFQFQDPRFILAMALIVTVIALNFFGAFEITLAPKAMNAAGSLASRSGFVGAFLNGVLATALATPCTAPFLGAGLGFAFSQPPAVTLAVFTSAGIGLALPYVLLSWNSRWLRWLPKPGPWLAHFRQAMGFPMLATALWLVWILSVPYGTSAGIAVAGWLLIVAFGVWLAGALQPGRFPWVLAAIIVIALAGYHQIAPMLTRPQNTGSFRASRNSIIDWQPFSQTALEKALLTSHPVFVDFTADWCLTCQVNLRTSLETDSVGRRFKEMGVIPLLADWTQPSDEITRVLRSFGRSGVPLYVLYPSDRSKPPILLPEVLTPNIVLVALASATAPN